MMPRVSNEQSGVGVQVLKGMRKLFKSKQIAYTPEYGSIWYFLIKWGWGNEFN